MEKSLCESCKNKLHIKYLKLPFRFNKYTGEQTQGNAVEEYDCSCIYFNSNRESALDTMLILECNKYEL